jgi:5-methylcytosine-specific restriction endonuclease McrA
VKAKGERSKLNKQLDTLAKTLAKERDDYTCQKCGKQERGSGMHGSHVIPVSAGAKLRWDLMNIKALCYHCHLNWWHKNPLEAGQWFRDTFPERAEYLEANRGIRKFTVQELKDLKQELTNQLKLL